MQFGDRAEFFAELLDACGDPFDLRRAVLDESFEPLCIKGVSSARGDDIKLSYCVELVEVADAVGLMLHLHSAMLFGVLENGEDFLELYFRNISVRRLLSLSTN